MPSHALIGPRHGRCWWWWLRHTNPGRYALERDMKIGRDYIRTLIRSIEDVNKNFGRQP